MENVMLSAVLWQFILTCDMSVNPQIPKGITSDRYSLHAKFQAPNLQYELTLDQMRPVVDENLNSGWLNFLFGQPFR